MLLFLNSFGTCNQNWNLLYTDDWYLILRAEKSSHPTCPVLANVANRMNVDAILSSPKYRPYKPPQEDNSFRVWGKYEKTIKIHFRRMVNNSCTLISKLGEIKPFNTFLDAVLVFTIEPKITNFQCHSIKG